MKDSDVINISAETRCALDEHRVLRQ